MNLKYIITSRNYNTKPFWDLVFEWENMFSQALNLPFYYENKNIYNRYIARVPFVPSLLQTSEPAFRFDMNPLRNSNANNKSNIIPCIVDFYLRGDEKLNKFYKRYNKNKIVFVSSREVYDYLKSNNCPLNIQHLALSISDKYQISEQTNYEKKYDLVMMGRQNPVLLDFVKRYAASHKNFNYVYRIQKNGRFDYYTSDGQAIGDIDTRDKYMALMRSGRVGLYGTPGMDDDENRTNGFNQLTPRFLELIACGCHIIARYPANSDTDYFELNKFCPSILTYSQFEEKMDYALSAEVNMKQYSDYLTKHYTSVRCKQLLQALTDI